MPTSSGQSERDLITRKMFTIASSLFECKRAPAFQIYKILTLENRPAFKYTDF